MATGVTLILEVADFRDPQHWRWVLKDRQGNFLQDQEVSLDPTDPNYHAFLNLQSHLDSNSSPDKRQSDQQRLLGEVSAWIGSNVLGKVADRLAQYRTPITVRVLVPPEASGLAYLPLELARVGDQALARRDLSLVFEVTGSEPTIPDPIGEKLRMLAVFSLPTDEEPLAMRRERYELTRLINRIAQTRSLAIDLRILQYGVTRENFKDALEEGEGWDIIHTSGHGERGSIYLEKPDGTSDEIISKELADLLRLARGRLKLVTLSSCHSAAATVEETLRWLGLWKPEMAKDKSISETSDGNFLMPAVAHQLATSLDCAALAMRYTVGDEFATELTTGLYELLFNKGQTLPRALQLSLRNTLTSGHNAVYNPLSLATPALFGRQAVDLVIKPPNVPGSVQLPLPGLAYFPDEPNKFVDRISHLISASAALAPESGKKGVLFYGMAGAGKTACALELTYHHSRSPRFQRFVWYKAPDEGKDIDRALLDLAMEMERRLPGLKIVQAVDNLKAFRDILPIISRALEENSVLIVLDNLESLLTSQDKWRDERWQLLIEALMEHSGYSRVILTSRRLPKDLKAERLAIKPIHALSLNEAVILAREMPNLGRLFAGRSTISPEKGRELVIRMLNLVQGHPKLIELAEAQASDPAALEKYLDKASQAWGNECRLASFFEMGESSQDAEDFLKALKGWTKSLSESLPEATRTLFHFICALEESDRQSEIIGQVWPELWKHLGLAGEAPDIDDSIQNLKALVEIKKHENCFMYVIHPAVAKGGLEEVEDKFQAAVDTRMAHFWISVFIEAQSGGDNELVQWVITAGLRSAPYLIRLKNWSEASAQLENVICRDSSPEMVASVLPLLRHIIMATKGTDRELKDSGRLASTLAAAGRWQEAEEILGPLISKFVMTGDFWAASTAAGIRCGILQRTGRYEEALELAQETKDYTQKAGLGPWTQLHDEVQRLEALNSLGRHDEVLKAVEGLRVQMRSLPERSDQDEATVPWGVREGIMSVGHEAATGLREHDLALELNAEMIGLMKSRGATDLDMARASFDDYSQLLSLKRYDDAERLLWACKRVFEKERSIEMLGKVFGALASLMYQTGHVNQAVEFLETSLRYLYLFGAPKSISVSHRNLAISLGVGSQSALDHMMAAVIIDYQTGSGVLPITLGGLAYYLDKFSPEALADSFDQLCDRLEQVEGVKFRELFHRLAGLHADGDRVMRKVIEMAKDASPESRPDMA